MQMKYYRCWEPGACFARSETGRCKILKDTYPESRCPFQKADVDVTSGVRYPYSEKYAKMT